MNVQSEYYREVKILCEAMGHILLSCKQFPSNEGISQNAVIPDIMPFVATRMPRDCDTESDRNIVWHPLYVESKKKWEKWTYKAERNSEN